MSIYGIIGNYLKEDKTGAIATVISRDGSAPRDVGAKMFVGEDRQIYGTIGGGKMEFDVYDRIMTIMGENRPEIVHIRMNAKEIAAKGMICGGKVDVLIEPVHKKYEELYNRLEYLENTDQNAVIATQFKEEKLLKTIIERDMEITGDEIVSKNKKAFVEYVSNVNLYTTEGILIEALHHAPSLYIFGGGHVSHFIAKIAKIVGFYIIIVDDREEFANKEKFPDADEFIVKPFKNVYDSLKFTGREFVVIVTRGHRYDIEVLRETLKNETRYVGMIGSKRKVKMILKHMRKIGFDDATVDRVHSPIGLFRAETPQEIAVSIVAELVKVRMYGHVKDFNLKIDKNEN